MVGTPLLAAAGADLVGDAEGRAERDASGRACGGDGVGLEVLDVSGGGLRDARGGRVIHRDRQRGGDVGGPGAGPGKGLQGGGVRVGHDRHRVRELGDPLHDGVIDEANATRRDDLTERDATRRVRAARPQKDDGPGLHLGELHGRPGRRHGQADADDPGRDVAPAEACPHAVPERRPQRCELGMKRREDEEVATHVRVTV